MALIDQVSVLCTCVSVVPKCQSCRQLVCPDSVLTLLYAETASLGCRRSQALSAPQTPSLLPPEGGIPTPSSPTASASQQFKAWPGQLQDVLRAEPKSSGCCYAADTEGEEHQKHVQHCMRIKRKSNNLMQPVNLCYNSGLFLHHIVCLILKNIFWKAVCFTNQFTSASIAVAHFRF